MFPVLSLWCDGSADQFRWMSHSMAIPKYMLGSSLLSLLMSQFLQNNFGCFVIPESEKKAKEFADMFAAHVEKFKESEYYKKLKEEGEVE